MHIVFEVIIIFSIIVIIYMLFTESYPKPKYIKYVNRQEGGNKINNGNNILCTKIFNEIDGDTVFSPMSITFALSLLHQGAQGNTDTQLTNLFNNKYTLNDLNQLYKLFNNDIMKMTNALLINKKYKVNNQYLDSIRKLVLIEYDDFGNKKAIVNKVNNYIEKNTNNMIKDILKENDVDTMTILILINTIYFKAKWLHEFKSSNTEKMQFNKNKNESLQVDMMYQKNNFDYYENDSIQLLEMSYKNRDYVMGIILPKNNDIPPKLTSDQIDEFISKLKNENVELYLPKFKHRKNIQLVPILQKLGVNDLFNASAKLSIAKEAYISKIIHEAVVIVDETGTEAAAVTVAVMTAMMAMPTHKKKIIFKADHPFIYYIRYKPNNMILFYGSFYGMTTSRLKTI